MKNKNICSTILNVNLTSGGEKWQTISLNTENSGIIWEKGKTYYICAFLNKQSNETVQVSNYDYRSLDNRTVSITFNGTIPYIRVGANTLNGNIVNEEVKIMVATSSFTDYVEHQEQTYIIPTQQPMRKIGDYADTLVKENGVWYEKHVIGGIVLDGTENWQIWSWTDGVYNNTSAYVLRDFENVSGYVNEESGCQYISNRFIYNVNNNYKYDKEIAYINNQRALGIRISKNIANNIGDWKAWLSTHNVKLIYQLVNPILLPCTQAQTEVLNQISKTAKSYKGGTHIYSTDEISPIFDVEYRVDKLSELETRIEQLESEVNA